MSQIEIEDNIFHSLNYIKVGYLSNDRYITVIDYIKNSFL